MFTERAFFIGALSAALSFAGNIPYLVSILRGNTKPHRVSFGIYTIIGVVTFTNQILNGGGYSTYFAGSIAFAVVIFFALSLKFGMGGSSKYDIATLICAGILFLLWIISNETRITTLLAIAIDVVATMPTILKAYKHPKTEIYWAWLVVGFGGFVTIFSVPNDDWVLFIWPIYIFVANLCIAGAKFLGERKISTN